MSKSDLNKIQKRVIRRKSFLYQVFGVHAPHARRLIHLWLSGLCERYDDSRWVVYELSNEAFYMAPSLDAPFTIQCPRSGDEVVVSADAAGLIATLYATNQLVNELGLKWIIELHHSIRIFAAQHDEAVSILSSISKIME